MATLSITRDEVAEIVADAKVKGRNKEAHVRLKLTQKYPGIEDAVVRRNGRVYKVLDYLADDLDSYA